MMNRGPVSELNIHMNSFNRGNLAKKSKNPLRPPPYSLKAQVLSRAQKIAPTINAIFNELTNASRAN
jgi:hypothetical protein